VNTTNDERVVAAFDFDGTLSTRDNVVPFLRRVAGTRATLRAATTSTVRVATSARAKRTRDALKAEVVRRVFAGRDAESVDALARDFAVEVVHRHLRAEAVARTEWHREQGHRVVIVSASFGAYLRPVAQQLGLDAVLATELEVGADGRLTGQLAGANVRGVEKARRLDEWIKEWGEPVVVWAYGNDGGDRELWARADHAVRIGRRVRLRARGA
jgi:phosphatidylglycerophosphatase C